MLREHMKPTQHVGYGGPPPNIASFSFSMWNLQAGTTWCWNRLPGDGNMTFSIFLTISKYLILLMEEILHQLLGSLSHHLQDFIHSRWLAGILPSTVCHKRLLNTKLLKQRLDAQSSGHSPCSQESKLTAFAMALDKSGPTCSASRRRHDLFHHDWFQLIYLWSPK